MNTYKRGTLRYLFIKESKQIVGVCLDLDITIEGNNFEKVKKELSEVSREHVEFVIKNKLSEKLLNRSTPKKYWNLYENVVTAKTTGNSSIVSPYQFINSKVVVNA